MEWFEITLLILYILIGILFFVSAFFLLRKRSLKAKMIFLYSVWAAGLIFLIVNKAFHFARGEHILAQLPLHLCYISLIFFIPMALRFKKKLFYDFIFYINSIGALMALLFPAKDYVSGIWSVITVTYIAFHYIIVCIPFWLFMWRIYSPKMTVVEALKIIGILVVLSLVMHGLNILLVKNGVAAANYFWTLVENARYNVNILRFFASIIPYDYVYIMAFAAPFLVLYIVAWNIGLRLVEKHKAKRVT